MGAFCHFNTEATGFSEKFPGLKVRCVCGPMRAQGVVNRVHVAFTNDAARAR